MYTPPREKEIIYRWPDLSAVIRQYVVIDDQGRLGIAHDNGVEEGALWAHPLNTPAQIDGEAQTGIAGAVLMTDTSWHAKPGESTYTGIWYDYSGPSHIPPELLRRITIVDDLGYLLPDKWAAKALAGSNQAGAWNYGATLGRVGGKPPVKGQNSDEMTVGQAEDYAREVGEQATARGIRLAASRGYIPGARKAGRDWLIPYEGMNHYLDNRPKPGRKA